jgi:hypothetical protein
MMRTQAAFYQMMQHAGEDVPLFASRLHEQAGLLGTLYTTEGDEMQVRSRFGS